MDLFRFLSERGYIAGFSEPLEELQGLLSRGTTIYQGFDPTAKSLHIGHLQSLMIFHYLQQAGHQLIFLIGGATGLVGDPSGREQGRSLLSQSQVQSNAAQIQAQVERIKLVTFGENDKSVQPALMLNNADWLNMDLLHYLREVTAHFSVNDLIRRETFNRRLSNQLNLSLLEFLYPTLQAYDFLHLFDHFGCQIQMGGIDQWGNITDGIEFIHRVRMKPAYGLVFPLLLDRSGQKMGKNSAGVPIWLNHEETSPFDFYQYWLSTRDDDLERDFKIFTFLDIDTIETILQSNPRQAQHRLAYEVTCIVHGVEAADQAREDALSAFQGGNNAPTAIPTIVISKEDLSFGIAIPQLLKNGGAVRSMGEARRLIQQGGIRLNNEKIVQVDRILSPDDFLDEAEQPFVVIRFGRGKALKIVISNQELH